MPRPPPRIVTGTLSGPDAVEQLLLCRAALSSEHLSLAERQPLRSAGQLLLDEDGECQIEVVATEQQVFADRNPFEHEIAGLGIHPEQAEVRGPAADVADQNESTLAECRHRPSWMRGDPRIQRRQRLLEQGDGREPCVARRLHGQFARFFVERRGDGQDDGLPFEPLALIGLAPARSSRRRADVKGGATRPARAKVCGSASSIHGSSAADRSTAAFDSHDLAEEICLEGTSAP